MKRILTLALILIICASAISGCKRNEKTVVTEGPKYAEKTLNAYKKLLGDNAVADGSYIRAFYDKHTTYFKVENGKLSEPNQSYVIEIRGEHIEITHDDLEQIDEHTALFLAVGSILPDGFTEKSALRQAEEALRLYQMPVSDGAEPRAIADEAIFVVEINDETFYYMCMDDAIRDQSAEYKELIKSDKYVLDENDFFSFTVTLYFKSDENYTLSQAKDLADKAIQMYSELPHSVNRETDTIPDESILVVKVEGGTYYFMCMDGAIKDQSKNYKKLVKSDNYKKSSIVTYENVTIYLKK